MCFKYLQVWERQYRLTTTTTTTTTIIIIMIIIINKSMEL